jgi:fatty-acid desaturase
MSTPAADRKPAVCPSRSFRFRRILWGNFLFIAALHLLCCAAPFAFTWGALAVAGALWAICGMGVTVGYHRLLAHRSFEPPRALRYLLAILGAASCQGGPVLWVGTHRLHHRDADGDSDPHSPRHGFSWAHMLWCVTEDPFDRDCRAAAADIRRDPGLALLDRMHLAPQILLSAGLYALGGLPWVVWGIGVRTVFTYHATWFVNSASHLWGYRTYETGEGSRNNWWVALITWGEGWHNNHHAFPNSARHGLRWFEVDPSWWAIRLLSRVGLARNVRVPTVVSR